MTAKASRLGYALSPIFPYVILRSFQATKDLLLVLTTRNNGTFRKKQILREALRMTQSQRIYDALR